MSFLLRLLLPLLLALTTACAHPPSSQVAADRQANDAQQPPSLEQKIYFFQHKVMPRWSHESDGNFYQDLQAGFHLRFFQLAEEMVSAEFSAGIVITQLADKQAVLFSFPSPTAAPACFFALLVKREQGYDYYTYERTIDLPGLPAAGVVGFWDAEGGHGNLGPRAYRDADSFVRDLLEPTD